MNTFLQKAQRGQPQRNSAAVMPFECTSPVSATAAGLTAGDRALNVYNPFGFPHEGASRVYWGA
jgi:hypothetical protein